VLSSFYCPRLCGIDFPVCSAEIGFFTPGVLLFGLFSPWPVAHLSLICLIICYYESLRLTRSYFFFFNFGLQGLGVFLVVFIYFRFLCYPSHYQLFRWSNLYDLCYSGFLHFFRISLGDLFSFSLLICRHRVSYASYDRFCFFSLFLFWCYLFSCFFLFVVYPFFCLLATLLFAACLLSVICCIRFLFVWFVSFFFF